MKTDLLLIWGLTGVLAHVEVQAVGIDPELRKFRQPCPVISIAGRPCEVEFLGRALGDEFVVFYETAEGYTIVQDERGYWSYADTGPQGHLIATEYLVGYSDPETVIGKKHRRPRSQILRAMQRSRAERLEEITLLARPWGRNSRAPRIPKTQFPRHYTDAQAPLTTHFRLAVLLIEFPDLSATYSPPDFAQLLFSEGFTYVSPAPDEPEYGSLRDYYLEMSNRDLIIEGEVFGWVTADQNKSYYERQGNLSFEAVAKSGVDLTAFDGYCVIYAGDTGSNSGNLWPQTLTAGGKLHYLMSEKWLPEYDFSPIGVHCHEFGHLLGLPDLYDTDFSSVGAGRWCTMSTGNYGGGRHERPYHLSAWSKLTLGWLQTNTIYHGFNPGLTLKPIASDREAAKLISYASYFLLENRQRLGYDLYLPGEGLLIWHVDERFGSQSVDQHRLLDLEEADGTETSGDAGDPFPGQSNNNSFGASTRPSSLDYDNHGYVEVSNVFRVGEEAHFEVTIDLGEGAGITVNSQGDFPNLFTAMEAAAPNGEVFIPRGSYYENNLRLKSGVVLRGEHPAFTIIDGQEQKVLEARNVSSGSIAGLTFTNGATALSLLNSDVTVAGNIITQMSVNGILCFRTNAILRNNTIVNVASSGITCLDQATPQVKNNILAFNGVGVARIPEASPELSYNDVWNNGVDYQSLAPGVTDIAADPLWVNPFYGDYSLRPESPCINTGDPDSTLNDPDGTRSDMGALPFDFNRGDFSGIRVNSGGRRYLLDDSTLWQGDQPYVSGAWGFVGGVSDSTADAIANTDQDTLYQSARRGLSAYLFDVPNGRYWLRLHFAEIIHNEPAKRIFEVRVEGVTLLQNYDIFALVGNDYAIAEQFLVEVRDGQMKVEFVPKVDEPLISAIEIAPHSPMFIDVAAFAKVADPGIGRAVALADYDGDGSTDIFVANALKTSALFQNNGQGTFINQTRSTGLDIPDGCEAGVWGDYDNNGYLDLYAVRNARPNLLYRNTGRGTFQEVATFAGVNHRGPDAGAAWGDYDNDGNLDLFVATAGPDLLYHNNGNGSFTEVAQNAGLNDGTPSSGGFWTDFNNDGYLDLLVTHQDYSFSAPNILYFNNGDGTFTGTPIGVNGQGATAGDFDHDGYQDLFMISVLSPLGSGKHLLFRNNHDLTFTEMADSAGLSSPLPGVSAAWGDFDNDGFLDLFILRKERSKLLFRNLGNGAFADITETAGVAGEPSVRTLATADFENDGDLDLYVAKEDTPNALFQNQIRGRNWLTVRTMGVSSNRAGIGATVKLIAGGILQVKEVNGGGGFRAQGSLPVEFGLGAATVIDTLQIRWPSGIVDTHTRIVEINRLFEAREGLVMTADTSPAGDLPIHFNLEPAFPNPARIGGAGSTAITIRYAIPRSVPVTLNVFNLLGQEVIHMQEELDSSPGFHALHWDGRDSSGRLVRSGIYFYAFKAADFFRVGKLVVLR